MPAVPFALRYTLTRRQRLLPHVRMWGIALTLFITVLEAFFLWIAFANIPVDGCWASLGFGLLFPGGLFLLYRGLFNGLLDVLLSRRRVVDMIVDDETAAILIRGERWHLFLDGITSIRQYHPDIWTIEHHNGSVLHIPATEITDDQLAHLRAAMERGRTPEGVQAVVERGRRIAQLEQQTAAAAAARHANP